MASKLQTKGSAWNLAPYADALGVRLSPTSTSHLETWLDGIATWNARIDLTAARSDDELLDLMLADALVVSKHVPEGASVVDVGTGAGAPGFALALARPDLRVTLVEPLAKRVSFLRTMIGTTLRTDVTLVRDRGESIRARGTTFDVAMARATLAPPEWLALGASLVRPGGDVWVLLAREPAPSGVGTAIETIPYPWPRTGAERTLVRYRT